jgi:class 3 adenylate cyclase/predicted ATPase
MTFEDLLDQAIDMLRRRGRVTYRALKLQFHLDDEYLDVLKDELIDGQQLAVDEDGRVLVWTGPPATPPAGSVSQVATPDNHPDQAPPVEDVPATAAGQISHFPDAERRQLTVLFCDLVDSTVLASQLDPEELREVVRAYQDTCAKVIASFEGHIAQYLGDGLLVYFGYPQAHEDDAERAVRSGLGMVEAMQQLNTRLERERGVHLAVRLGIHTGLVVVGEVGGGPRQEQLALGETPNVAARLQGIASPNTLVISATTYDLIQGYFVCQDHGPQALKGVATPIRVYRVLRESRAQGRMDIAAMRGLTPLVGRESEITFLRERWEHVKEGQGHVVLLSGEAGIGKSRLVHVLREHIASTPNVRWEWRSSPYHQYTALYPISDFFQRTLSWQPEDTPDEKLAKLEQALCSYRLALEEAVPLFATLLSLSLPAGRYAPLTLAPQRQRQKTLETIVAILLALAERQPVLCVVEDLHWADPTTLALLDLLIEQIPTAPICAVLTCRPTFQPPWSQRSYLTQLTLGRLSRPQVAQMVASVASGKPLPAEVMQSLVEKVDGVPLFVEEMTKATLESGHLTESDGHYALVGPLPSLAIPTTLQDSLMARLDRLVTAKAVAQYAAVIGRQFAYELLQAVTQLDAATLQRELGRLVEAELIYQRGLPPQALYVFKHALITDIAYQSLLKGTRQQYHRRSADVLIHQFPTTAATQPEVVAHHYTEAGLHAPAITYWQQAGEKATQRSAHVEAIVHCSKGVALLTTLPETPERALQELTLQRMLGVSLLSTKGFAAPEVESAYARARALCQQVGDAAHLGQVLFGLWGFYKVRDDLQTAREVAEELLTLGQRQDDPALRLQGHRALGDSLISLGEFVAGLAQVEQGIALYDAQRHRAHAFLYGQDPGAGCLSYAAQALWILGYPDQALQRSQASLTLAHGLSHPFSLAHTLLFVVTVHAWRREWDVAQTHAEALLALATEMGFAQYVARGTYLRGWALAMQGQAEEGIAQLRQGLDALWATGSGQKGPMAMLAQVYGHSGHIAEGLAVLADVMAGGANTGGRDGGPLYRLKGDLLVR